MNDRCECGHPRRDHRVSSFGEPCHAAIGGDDLFGLCPCNQYRPARDELPDPLPHFDGRTYDGRFDHERLGKQARAVFLVMRDRQWRTLHELSVATGYPEASISARLRDFRKPKFGGHVVEDRRRGDATRGLWEYRLTVVP